MEEVEMKTVIQILATVVVLMLCQPTNGVAQKLPDDLLEAAKVNFTKAFQLEFGEEPSKKEVDVAMKQYARAVNSWAAQMGTRAGKEASRLRNVRRSFASLDGLALIDVLREMRIDSLSSFGFEKSKIADLVQSDMAINQIDGRALIKDPKSILNIEDNTEIVFPAGTYSFNERQLMRILDTAGKKFPVGITFVGDGKDTTTLKLNSAGFTRKNIGRLGFRDMTIDCDNDGLFDKRQGCLTLMLSNVRLVRFDAGHGGCRLFAVNDGLIVYAKDTEFIGGFGRSPGHGSIFSSSKVFMGHFERCSFFGIEYGLFRMMRDRSSLLWMDECSFDRKPMDKSCVELKDCKTDAKQPEINWAPEKDTEIENLGG